MTARSVVLRFASVFGAITLSALAATTAPEPANLSPAKEAVRSYVTSGAYDRGVAAVAAEAGAWLEQRAARADAASGKLAIVMDLDETLLRNAEQILQRDFAYDRAAWQAWVRAAKAPALEPVRKLYAHARQLNIRVIFLTARRERERAASEQNLRWIGCDQYEALVCAPNDSREASGSFKQAERRRLQESGYVIVANVGDQLSDFEGGYAERDFKIPNPFYLSK